MVGLGQIYIHHHLKETFKTIILVPLHLLPILAVHLFSLVQEWNWQHPSEMRPKGEIWPHWSQWQNTHWFQGEGEQESPQNVNLYLTALGEAINFYYRWTQSLKFRERQWKANLIKHSFLDLKVIGPNSSLIYTSVKSSVTPLQDLYQCKTTKIVNFLEQGPSFCLDFVHPLTQWSPGLLLGLLGDTVIPIINSYNNDNSVGGDSGPQKIILPSYGAEQRVTSKINIWWLCMNSHPKHKQSDSFLASLLPQSQSIVFSSYSWFIPVEEER